MKPVQKASMGQGHLVICVALTVWGGREQLGGGVIWILGPAKVAHLKTLEAYIFLRQIINSRSLNYQMRKFFES